METTNITTSTPSLYADDIPLIESTTLSELEQYNEIERHLERQNFDNLCDNDEFLGSNN